LLKRSLCGMRQDVWRAADRLRTCAGQGTPQRPSETASIRGREQRSGLSGLDPMKPEEPDLLRRRVAVRRILS